MNEINKQFVEEMYKSFGTDIVSRSDINVFTKENGYKDQGWLKTDQYKVSRGKYQLPIISKTLYKVINFCITDMHFSMTLNKHP